MSCRVCHITSYHITLSNNVYHIKQCNAMSSFVHTLTRTLTCAGCSCCISAAEDIPRCAEWGGSADHPHARPSLHPGQREGEREGEGERQRISRESGWSTHIISYWRCVTASDVPPLHYISRILSPPCITLHSILFHFYLLTLIYFFCLQFYSESLLKWSLFYSLLTICTFNSYAS